MRRWRGSLTGVDRCPLVAARYSYVLAVREQLAAVGRRCLGFASPATTVERPPSERALRMDLSRFVEIYFPDTFSPEIFTR